MLCPNCQKEAINVNGKYVCLDCGVEITANDAQTTVPEPTAVINHGFNESPTDVVDSFNDPQNQTVAEPFVGPAVIPNNPAMPQDNSSAQTARNESEAAVEKPVEDFYLKSLSEDDQTTGNYDFSANQDVPVAPETADLNLPEVPQNNQEEVPASLSDATTSVATEVPTEPMSTMSETAVTPTGGTEATVNEAPEAPAVTEPVILSTQPSPTEPEVSQELSLSNSEPQTEQGIPISVPNVPVDVSVKPTEPTTEPVVPVNTPDEPVSQSQVAESSNQENFFQPASVDIATQSVPAEPKPLDTFDAFSTPAGPGQSESKITESEPTPAPVSTTAPEPQGQGETPSLDDLLDSYSTPAGAAPVSPSPAPETPSMPAVTPLTTPQSASVDTLIPPVSQDPNLANPQAIPSVENVFGSGQSPAAIPQKNNKKYLLMIGAGILGLLLVTAVIFGIRSLTKTKGLTSEQLLKISQDVSTAMDDSEATSNTFKEKIDFTNASIVELSGNDAVATELRTAFAKPVETSGSWQEDSGGNSFFDGTIAGIPTKKALISSENIVYNFANGAWKKDTVKNLPEFPLFSLAAKGQLFYNSKVESLSSLGKKRVGDEEIQKLKIVPKSVLVQDIFAAEVPALAKNNYRNIDLKNLNIIAEVDSANTIKTVTVSGSVEVESDFFTGTVTLDVNSVYEYENIEEITIPEVRAEVIKPTAVKPEYVETDTVEATQRRVVITDLRG